jgi:hypothetical protein
MRNLQVLKLVTAFVSTLALPVGVYIGFTFGEQRWLAGSIVLACWSVVTFVDFYLYLYVLKETVKSERG